MPSRTAGGRAVERLFVVLGDPQEGRQTLIWRMPLAARESTVAMPILGEREVGRGVIDEDALARRDTGSSVAIR